MTFNPTLSTAIIGLFMLFTLGIGLAGWRALPSSNLEDYLLANRGVSSFVGYFSIAGSQFSALTMMGFVAFYFQLGVSAFLGIAVAYTLLTGGLYYFIAPRIWKIGRKHGHITPSDFVSDFYDSRLLGYIVAVGLILALIPYLQLQFTGIGILITLGTGGLVPISWGAVFIAVVIAIYVWLGGMKSIAWVDAFQGVLLIGGAIIGGLTLVFTVGDGFGPAFQLIQADRPELLAIPQSGAWSWPFIVTFSIGVFFGWVFHPHIWIRIHYFKSGRAVERLPWVIGSLNWFAAFGGWLVMLAGATALSDVAPDQFMLLMFREFFPTAVFAIFASAVLAAMMSSASSQCHGIGAVSSRDISEHVRPAWGQDRHLTVARVTTMAAIVAAVALSFAGIPFLLTSGAAAAALAASLIMPQVVAGVYGWGWTTREGALAGSLAGGLVALLFLAVPWISSPWPGVWDGFFGLVVNVAVFGIVSAATASHPDAARIRSWNETFEQPFAVLEREYRDREEPSVLPED